MTRRGKLGLWVALVLCLGFVGFRWWTSHEIEREQEGIRDAGFPVTFVELNEFYSTAKSGENRADDLVRAFDATVPSNPGIEPHLPIAAGAELPNRTEPFSEEMVLAIRAFILQNQDALEYISDAMGHETCRFPIDFQTGTSGVLRHLAEMRGLARRTHLAALLAVIEQDSKAAIDGIVLTLGLAESLETEPVLMSQLVRMALCGHGIAALEESLSRIRFTHAELTQLQEHFAATEASRGMRNGAIGARCELYDDGIGAFWTLKAGGSRISLKNIQNGLLQLIGVLDVATLESYKSYAGLIEFLDKPNEEQIAAVREQGIETRTIGLSSVIVDIMAAEDRNRAKLRTAIVAVAAERYHLDHEAYPTSADELVPAYLKAVPLDPCGGAPIRYRQKPRGFVAYSIAQNLVDDGGTELDHGDNWREGDLTFTVERGE